MRDLWQPSCKSVLWLLAAKKWNMYIDTVAIKIEIPFFHASFLANVYLILDAFFPCVYFCLGYSSYFHFFLLFETRYSVSTSSIYFKMCNFFELTNFSV